MTKHLHLIAAVVVAFALQSNVAIAQQAIANSINVPPVPAGLQVQNGHKPFLKGEAVGTQNYACMPSGSSFAWTFMGPQATLFVRLQWLNFEITQQIATHYLTPNPSESGLPRPIWQSSLDTSSVSAKAIASSDDPNYVAPGAIPWLLLERVGAQQGPMGGSTLSITTFIQRLNTSGGAKPAIGCSQAGDVGKTVFVPYTADYFFYKAM